MPRYVIGPDVARRLAQEQAVIAAGNQLVAPTLLRSQLLSALYRAVHQGEITKKDADAQLTYVRGLQIRLLGDRVLQSVAWKLADQLGWSDTFDAEYIALTQLHADALITLDEEFAAAVSGLVIVAPFQVLQDAVPRPKA
jgi:predicted nucleic acid-binding protein